MHPVVLRAACAAALGVVACGSGPDLPSAVNSSTNTGTNTNVVTSVVISPSSVATLTVGGTTSLSASAKNGLGQDVGAAAITWSSSASNVAAVSGGVVSALSAGTAQITAATGSVSATISLNVVSLSVTDGPETLATLPQTYLNTTAPPAPDAGGQVHTVSTATSFQNALNSANFGDVIAIQNGVTLIGNFTLANRGTSNGGKWITIRPVTMTGLPAEGSRMTPAIAAALQLPIILSPNNLGAISSTPGAHHIRIIGIEVSQVSTVASNTGLVRLGEDGTNPQKQLATVPHDFVLDRMYIHGLLLQNTRRCVGLNSGASAVIDSYLSACHENGADAQAIAGWNGPGPFKIVNNYLEASGENIMFGGADPNVPNLTPSDIEIRHNHFFKPTSWKGIAQHWLVKNLFELKHAQRVLVEGNLFENNWTDGQSGTAIAIKTVNQDGACNWCVTQDVTFRYNLVRNVGGAFTVSGSPDNAFADIPARRLTITDNIVHTINTATYDGIGQGALLNGDVSDLVFAHNTIVDPTSAALTFGGGTNQPMIRLAFRDNIIGGGVNGMKGSGVTAGTVSLNTFAPSARFTNNVITLSSTTGYPTGNYYPTALASIFFSALTSFDFHLIAGSAYKEKATDGVDPGANVDAVLSAIAGVIVP